MRAISTLLAAAVLVTCPIGAAQAQSAYEDCMANCDQVYQQEAQHCAQYGASLDGEYCYMAIAQDYQGCTQACSSQQASVYTDDLGVQRFRPIDIKVAFRDNAPAHRG